MAANIQTKCKECSTIFVQTRKQNKTFCNSSCAATYNNKNRKHAEKTKIKISNSLKLKKGNPRVDSHFLFKRKVSGEYCRIFIRTCKHCNDKFVSRIQVHYCEKHSSLYGEENYNRYRFTFAISSYPDLFENISQQFNDIGIRSHSNPYGLTRDHRVSVKEAIKNNYDPYYIRHPLNCEIMPWLDNIKKYSKSSLLYSELKKIVDEYEKK